MKLYPDRIQNSLSGDSLKGPVMLFDYLSSTNDVGLLMVREGAGEGMIILTDCQMEGRGRLRRRWISVPGKSIVLSVILRPEGELEGFTLLCGYSVVKALSKINEKFMIKWPNDIFVDGKKVGGILTEATYGAVVVGIGMNVNEDHEDFAPQIKNKALSLKICCGREFDREEVISLIINSLDKYYERWKRDGFDQFRDKIESRMVYMGKKVELEIADGILRGTVEGITEKGYLKLNVNGNERTFSSGDLFLGGCHI